jgi:hypothetical protein
LAPLGLNSDTFLAQQKEMSDFFVDKVTSQMQAHQSPDVEAIVLGRDGENANIYTVDYRGMLSCLNDVGFAAIGIGAWHAKSNLMQAGYQSGLSLAPALAAAFTAKKSAEVAPGVGTNTDIHILTKNGHFPLWPDVQKKLHDLYEDYQRSRSRLAEAAVLELDRFMVEQRPVSGKSFEPVPAASPTNNASKTSWKEQREWQELYRSRGEN